MAESASRYLYVAQIAIPAELEARFAELYDTEHIPALMLVPGVMSCDRYKLVWADTPEMPEYMAIYEVAAPDIPKSEPWRLASNQGQWPHVIRPHMIVRRHGMFERLAAFDTPKPLAS